MQTTTETPRRQADLDWWAGQNADTGHATEPTPLEVLDDAEPFDADAPEPPGWDDLYHDRAAEESLCYGTFGHPA
jgi:hypothetical protein